MDRRSITTPETRSVEGRNRSSTERYCACLAHQSQSSFAVPREIARASCDDRLVRRLSRQHVVGVDSASETRGQFAKVCFSLTKLVDCSTTSSVSRRGQLAFSSEPHQCHGLWHRTAHQEIVSSSLRPQRITHPELLISNAVELTARTLDSSTSRITAHRPGRQLGSRCKPVHIPL